MATATQRPQGHFVDGQMVDVTLFLLVKIKGRLKSFVRHIYPSLFILLYENGFGTVRKGSS